MSDPIRRFECVTLHTAEQHARAQKLALRNSAAMKLRIAIHLALAVLIGLNAWLNVQTYGRVQPQTWALLGGLALLIAYIVWYFRSSLKRVERRFREANPEGPFTVTSWVEGDTFHLESGQGQGKVLLSSFRRLLSGDGLVLLMTKEKQILIFDRKALPDAEWTALCEHIKTCNPRFKYSIK